MSSSGWIAPAALLCSLSFTLARGAAVTSPGYFDHTLRPLLKQYCFPCHSSEKHKGDFDMERFSSVAEIKRHPKVWQEVAEKLANHEMPPEEKPQPSAAERERLSHWVVAVLDAVAQERAGDPGPVVLRRLSNAEYTYTIQDLTDVESLQPAREFPVDGAAGEGFMNTGQALVMSPSLLTKYFDAGKEIASHAVLLPDGIRFSPKTTRRDWTEEILQEIRAFYRQFTDPRGGDKVNLQGIVFETNEGGRLPVEKYLAATLAMRGVAAKDNQGLDAFARERGLNARYLRALSATLSAGEPSLLLDKLRARWRKAKPDEAAELAAEVAQWQKALWKFNTVGHIGKLGGPKAWMEPVNPLIAKQEVRLKVPAAPEEKEVTLYLVASDAGDGNENDFVVWEKPRLVAPGRPDLWLRDVREVSRELVQRRERIFASAAKCLNVAAEADASHYATNIAELARKHDIDAEALVAWLDFLGIGAGDALKIDSWFTNKMTKVSNYDFINGWGSPDTPSLFANSSDQHVRIPGNMKPHGVAVHPSPTLQAAVGWRCPTDITAQVQARVTHAHPECGNGITWSLELRRGVTRQRLASGTAQGNKEVKIGPFEDLALSKGDLVSVLIGPRDGNHACDLTAVDLVLTTLPLAGVRPSSGAAISQSPKASRESSDPAPTGHAAPEDGRTPPNASSNSLTWDLAADVSTDVLAGNPHADRFGNEGVWHFYTEPDNGGNGVAVSIPAGSLLARWQSASKVQEKRKLADELQNLLTSGPLGAKDSPDVKLYQQLASLRGPLFNLKPGSRRREEADSTNAPTSHATAHRKQLPKTTPDAQDSGWGLDPALFGLHPNEQTNDARITHEIDPASLYVHAPSVIEFRLPADLAAGCEFVTTGMLESEVGAEGSVQLQVLTTKPDRDSGLLPATVTATQANGPWTSDNRRIALATPVVVNEHSQVRQRFEAAFEEFRLWFPTALCYTKIVPVDEAVTLTLYYREDDQLARLMLDDEQKAKLDRMWDQLHYISHDAPQLVDAFEQLWQYATQDADPKVFEPLRKPIQERAAAFRQRLIDTEPRHVRAALDFANRAYRRPLSASEQEDLQGLYRRLREQEVAHDEAIHLLLARVLVAPAFLYRAENPGPGVAQVAVNDWELANRLSYFLWSSMPDPELAANAAAGKLHKPEILAGQTRRMLADARVRRLAIEFACQWLHIHDFDTLDEKSERHFPTFGGLRAAMYEESILFFTDLFRRNESVLDILDADYTFLNQSLAEHYGISGVKGSEWRRVEGVRKFARGGILGQASTLAKQSGASRTSPILRGNWVAEALLGDKLPKPPKDVPRLPEDEATENLTVRQLTEKHDTDPRCFVCHRRIDAFGFALEGFDAIGRRREHDLGGRPIDSRAKAMDGTQFEDISGLREYLLTQRRDAFLRQFCRKLLGYALGRAVQLSDEPLLKEMRAQMNTNGCRIGALVEAIVLSHQFREIRGKEMAYED